MTIHRSHKIKKAAKETLHIRKCPFLRFKEFVMTVGYDELVGIIKYIGENYNEIIV